MLTRIAYHLLGMAKALPQPLMQQVQAPQRSLRRLVKESQKGKQEQTKEDSTLDEGEEVEIPEG